MKTFLIRNRHGREVQVTEELARNMLGNPSVTILGEIDVTLEDKEILVPVKNKPAKKIIRTVATAFKLKNKVAPGGGNADVENKGNLVKRKTVVDRGGTEIKKSSVLKD